MGFIYLVPARQGSQGIILKNLQKIGNRTLVEIAVGEALASRHEGPVWVNSDSEFMTNLGVALGARPYLRPKEYSGAEATADDVVRDFISSEGLDRDDVLVYLQPTSPFRKSSHIERAIDLFIDSGRKSVTSVAKVAQHPRKMLRRLVTGELAAFTNAGKLTSNRQTLEEVLIPNGAIYVFTVAQFWNSNGFPVEGSIPYLMGERESLDIDSPLDLKIAQLLNGDRGEEEAQDGK